MQKYITYILCTNPYIIRLFPSLGFFLFLFLFFKAGQQLQNTAIWRGGRRRRRKTQRDSNDLIFGSFGASQIKQQLQALFYFIFFFWLLLLRQLPLKERKKERETSKREQLALENPFFYCSRCAEGGGAMCLWCNYLVSFSLVCYLKVRRLPLFGNARAHQHLFLLSASNSSSNSSKKETNQVVSGNHCGIPPL